MSHAPSLHCAFAQAHVACGGFGPSAEQRRFGSPSSACMLQLSSLPLHVSSAGVLAVQPSNLPVFASHVSLPTQSPKLFMWWQAFVTPSRFLSHEHDWSAIGTQYLC